MIKINKYFLFNKKTTIHNHLKTIVVYLNTNILQHVYVYFLRV